ncbi:MAG: sulfate transporter CysZ [Legionella sp.]
MRNFFYGMRCMLLGIRHLFLKGLKRFILLPLLVNFMMFAGMFYLVYHYLLPYATSYLNQLPSWLSFLSGVFLLLFIISFFLMFLSVFTVVFNLVAAPVNGLLAEKVQKLLYRSSIPSLPFHQTMIRSVKRHGAFILYFLPRFAGMCVLFFITLVQPIYPILWFLFNAWILSIQYQDFAMDNNLICFKEMREQIAGNRMLLFGFGSSIILVSLVPILNVLTMPASVIAGTILYFESNKRHELIEE